MKKNVLMAVMFLVMAGMAFADNHHFGIDITAAAGFGVLSAKEGSVKFDQAIIQPEIRASSFNGIWLDHKLGFYTILGIGGNIEPIKDTNKVLSGVAIDYAIGPCFGIDIDSLRFNIGLGLHVNAANVFSDDMKTTVAYGWFGAAVSPQLKVTADKRCSFVVGADLCFDGFVDGESATVDGNGNTTNKTKITLKDAFRFSANPYAGVSIAIGSN